MRETYMEAPISKELSRTLRPSLIALHSAQSSWQQKGQPVPAYHLII